MMYEVSVVHHPDHKVWIPAGSFDPKKHTKHAERPITADDMLDWIDFDWPIVEADSTGTVITRLEPGQGMHNMFRGQNVREALLKAMTTPAYQGVTPDKWDQMSNEEQMKANSGLT